MAVRKFWFAGDTSVPAFTEQTFDPTGEGFVRAVDVPSSGVKGVRAVELRTFSLPIAQEAAEARSMPGAYYSTTWLMRGYRLSVTVVDAAWLAVLRPDTSGDLTLVDVAGQQSGKG